MEARQEQCPAPSDLALETGRAWTLWLTAVERWLLPRLARREARHPAWAVAGVTTQTISFSLGERVLGARESPWT